jgi:TRAP-type C4-dicarboxylate transport system permease small subunit
MDILKNKLPQSAGGIANIVIFILLAGFLCLIASEGYDLALRAMRQTSPAAKIPVGYITMAIPVGSILALVFLAEQQMRQFLKGKSHD